MKSAGSRVKKMAKDHLKRINSPNTWPITRKDTVFVLRPNPGGHPMEHSVSLHMLLTDMLKVAHTAKGVRFLLQTQEVLVNGKRRHRPDDTVGVFDIITFPATKTSYRIVINKLNKLVAIPVAGDDAKLVACKVTSKTPLKGKKLQVGCHNGRTLLVSKEYAMQGTLLLADNKEKDFFPLEKGASVVLIGGTHVGSNGAVETVEGNKVIVKTQDGEVKTDARFAFVLGKAKPAIKIE